MVDGSVVAVIKNLKVFLKWCYGNDIIKNQDYKTYFYAIKKYGTKVSLSESELKIIEKFVPKQDYLKRVKDIFLLECYTGVRISDLYSINTGNIDKTKKELKVFQGKTMGYAHIPIHQRLEKILKKYPDLQLPLISKPKYNQYIKELCKNAGIDDDIERVKTYGKRVVKEVVPKYKMISSKTARATFITLLSKMGLIVEEIKVSSGQQKQGH